jgi:hypothetical protein
MQRVWRTHCTPRESNMIEELYSKGWEVVYMKKPSSDSKMGRLMLRNNDDDNYTITVLYKKDMIFGYRFSLEGSDIQPPQEITDIISKWL